MALFSLPDAELISLTSPQCHPVWAIKLAQLVTAVHLASPLQGVQHIFF